jgi:hypothetical protein
MYAELASGDILLSVYVPPRRGSGAYPAHMPVLSVHLAPRPLLHLCCAVRWVCAICWVVALLVLAAALRAARLVSWFISPNARFAWVYDQARSVPGKC